MELNDTQIETYNELVSNYKATQFNYYNKVKLFLKTGVTDKELWQMHKEGIITKAKGVNNTLIMLTDKTINEKNS